MTVFLFWNINKKPVHQHIANLANNHKVDVLMLAENAIPPEVLLSALNLEAPQYHYVTQIACKRIQLFVRFPRNFISILRDKDRFVIYKLVLPQKPSLLLTVVHLPSKLHSEQADQDAGCEALAREIKHAEEQVGHSRTILVGDLNMNPFEDGIVRADRLHGVMSRSIAEKKSRTISSERYTYFYNPMWNFMGDIVSKTPGTYYYNKSKIRCFFWNTFDQVLIRPDLLPFFDNESIEILHSDGKFSFLSSEGTPNPKISDHLPILFNLKFSS